MAFFLRFFFVSYLFDIVCVDDAEIYGNRNQYKLQTATAWTMTTTTTENLDEYGKTAQYENTRMEWMKEKWLTGCGVRGRAGEANGEQSDNQPLSSYNNSAQTNAKQ